VLVLDEAEAGRSRAHIEGFVTGGAVPRDELRVPQNRSAAGLPYEDGARRLRHLEPQRHVAVARDHVLTAGRGHLGL
jgi:hypothetical protein